MDSSIQKLRKKLIKCAEVYLRIGIKNPYFFPILLPILPILEFIIRLILGKLINGWDLLQLFGMNAVTVGGWTAFELKIKIIIHFMIKKDYNILLEQEEFLDLLKMRGIGVLFPLLAFTANIIMLLYLHLVSRFDFLYEYIFIFREIYIKYIYLSLFLFIFSLIDYPFVYLFRNEIRELAKRKKKEASELVERQ